MGVQSFHIEMPVAENQEAYKNWLQMLQMRADNRILLIPPHDISKSRIYI